jgi:transcription elongation factor Elf1
VSYSYCPKCGSHNSVLDETLVSNTFQCDVCDGVFRIEEKAEKPTHCAHWKYTGLKHGYCLRFRKSCFICEDW